MSISLRILKINSFDCWSKLAVDSSNNNVSGRIIRALINDIFCICPDESVLFETSEDIPKSVGVNIIGNKNHLISDLFIIDKGYSSGISIGNYIISDNKIIGRIKTVNSNSSEVVGVLNFDYGDEVLINEKSYIISGNNTELIFIRQKDSTEELNLIVGDIAKIKIGNHYIKIGNVDLLDNKFVIKTKLITSYSTARVIIGD